MNDQTQRLPIKILVYQCTYPEVSIETLMEEIKSVVDEKNDFDCGELTLLIALSEKIGLLRL